MSLDERKAIAQAAIEKHSEYVAESHRTAILEGTVSLGMTPYEAKLAGGAFTFRVVPDPSKWPAHADPLQVMSAQSLAPDDSEIWMTFENCTQFPGESATAFRVHFQKGRAVRIEKV